MHDDYSNTEASDLSLESLKSAIEAAEKAHSGESMIRMHPIFARIEISDKPYPDCVKLMFEEEDTTDASDPK